MRVAVVCLLQRQAFNEMVVLKANKRREPPLSGEGGMFSKQTEMGRHGCYSKIIPALYLPETEGKSMYGGRAEVIPPAGLGH